MMCIWHLHTSSTVLRGTIVNMTKYFGLLVQMGKCVPGRFLCMPYRSYLVLTMVPRNSRI